MAHSVVLGWVDSIDASAGYNVYRSTTSGLYTAGPLNGTTPLVAGTTSFTDSTVVTGNTYFYVATAVLNGLESVHSNEISARILPGAPTQLVVSSIS